MNLLYMKKAIEIAREAATFDEVPVGAVMVRGEEILAVTANRKERDLHHEGRSP